MGQSTNNQIELLVIDDDHLLHNIISKIPSLDEFNIRYADNGEKGIEMADQLLPDIILLDVEMPILNGYETCIRLRENEKTKQVPILFLSAHSSLKDRMKGYEAGGDDYLAKPFENDLLLARINILLKYQQQSRILRELYQNAQLTATTALTGLGELGTAMQFLEKSISYANIDELVSGLFQTMSLFQLDCYLMLISNNQVSWYSQIGAVSPIEKDLIEMSDKQIRFLDFGEKTLVNYPVISLLVKNMPLDDMDKYGRVKDILPVLVAAANVKIGTFDIQQSLISQNGEMLETFKNIRRYLFHMGTAIVNGRDESKTLTNELIQSLHADLLRMGLEQDQEDYLIDQIDSVSQNILEKMNSGAEIRDVLDYILSNLKNLIGKQESIINDFADNLKEQSQDVEEDVGIELF
ncbi:MAG: response regulator [Gammaproteobacteria bacterium]|nr:MAG: response regulator [Gammaproteobacteria bacterium]